MISEFIIEALAVSTTILSVIILARGKSSGWLFSVIGSVFYCWIFVSQKLYMNALIQIVFILQGLFGLFKWNKEVPANEQFHSIKLDFASFLIFSAVSLAVSVITTTILSTLLDAQYQFVDTTLSVFSIFATIMLIKRYIQAWFIWMIVDVGYVYLFFEINLWLSTGLYLLLFILCINGYVQWNKKGTIKNFLV